MAEALPIGKNRAIGKRKVSFRSSRPACREFFSLARNCGIEKTDFQHRLSLIYRVNMQDTHKNLMLYIAKCIASAGLIYFLSYIFHYPDITWCLISAVLVLSPDAKEALPFAQTRIAANLVGGASTLFCMLGGFPQFVTIFLAYCLTITTCFLFRIMNASRTALAAATIITLAPSTEAHLWDKALERVLSVAAGCLVGLVITLTIHRRFSGPGKVAPSEHTE
jgi:uncharacterized membrane protein YccC